MPHLRVSLDPARLALLGRAALILVKSVSDRELSKYCYRRGRSHLPLFRYLVIRVGNHLRCL